MLFTIYTARFTALCLKMPVFGALFHSKSAFSILPGVMLQPKQPRTGHDQSAAPARWKAGSAAAAMGRSIRASPADKTNSQSQTAAQHPAGERFLCSLRLNRCRSGPIRPTSGTPERQNAQKSASNTSQNRPRRPPNGRRQWQRVA